MADIAAAARSVFMKKGFRRAQVADVAAAAGLSPAALYRHVESKDALFYLCFVEDLPGADEYVPTPTPGETLELITARLKGASASGLLRPALKEPSDDPAAELGAIITDLYRMLQRNRELMALVEASTSDRPELHDLYYRQRRSRFTDDLASYLQQGARAGRFRAIDQPKLVAMQIREACSWFAWHRHGDRDTPLIADDDALASIVDLYVHGLVRP
jgi:AcrR family transcriptional regulator